ncbi:hypothetical protein BN1708_007722, partial [Verticillium longisporum]
SSKFVVIAFAIFVLLLSILLREPAAATMPNYKEGIMPLYQVHKPPFTIEAPGYEKVEGETLPRRSPKAKDGLRKRPAEDVNTIYDIVKRSARVYPNEPAAGTRKLIKLHKETKKISKNVDGEVQEVEKEWQFFELSPFSFLTYAELHKYILQLGSGLRKLGLSKGNRLHFYATTQPLKKAKTVKFLIYNDASHFATGNEVEAFKKANPDTTLYSIEEVRQLGEDNPVDPVEPSPEDLFCIMYTSGSTGLPKGVPMTHENVLAAVTGLYTNVEECVSHNEYILAYLPLAHIFEMVLENIVLFIGGTLGYGNARTLSDTSMRNCAGDMRELRPTVMVGVPQVWETVKKGIEAKVNSAGAVTKALFWGAFNYKTFMSKNNLPLATVLDSVVFAKVRQLTGGRLRFTMNGASGISDGTKHFLSMTVAPMLTGYGLTETGANGALGDPLEYTSNAIGPVPAAADIKLVSLPELNYSTDSTPPQGEILIKGPAIFKEYFNNKEETEKVITADGWFKTGDIGEFDAVGHLRVIDRVKNLVKMQGGEYIALEKLESVYRGSQFVANIMIDTDPDSSRPIAVIAPNEKTLTELAQKLGVDEAHQHSDRKVKDTVLKDLVTVGKNGGLGGIEIISAVVLVEDEWTPASGLVTATQKVNRRALREHYKTQIAKAFGK